MYLLLQVLYWINPSNAVATFAQSTRMQRFFKTIKTLSCWYSLESSCWALSDEYPFAKGFNGFSGFLHNFVLANLAVSSIRVKHSWTKQELYFLNIICLHVAPHSKANRNKCNPPYSYYFPHNHRVQHRLQNIICWQGKLLLKLTCPAGTSTCLAILLNKGEIGLKTLHAKGGKSGSCSACPIAFFAECTCNLQKWLCCTLNHDLVLPSLGTRGMNEF